MRACLTSVAAGSREEEGVGCQKEGGSGPKARAKGRDDTRRRRRRGRAGGEEVEVEERSLLIMADLMLWVGMRERVLL